MGQSFSMTELISLMGNQETTFSTESGESAVQKMLIHLSDDEIYTKIKFSNKRQLYFTRNKKDKCIYFLKTREICFLSDEKGYECFLEKYVEKSNLDNDHIDLEKRNNNLV